LAEKRKKIEKIRNFGYGRPIRAPRNAPLSELAPSGMMMGAERVCPSTFRAPDSYAQFEPVGKSASTSRLMDD